MTSVEVVEIFEISKEDLKNASAQLPYSRACLSVFIPYDRVGDVKKNIYTQLAGAEDIVTHMENIGITEENGLSWAKNVVKGLKTIIKTFKAKKDTIDERGMSLYNEPSQHQKVYLIRSCAPFKFYYNVDNTIVDDINKSVICDDRFFLEVP